MSRCVVMWQSGHGNLYLTSDSWNSLDWDDRRSEAHRFTEEEAQAIIAEAPVIVQGHCMIVAVPD